MMNNNAKISGPEQIKDIETKSVSLSVKYSPCMLKMSLIIHIFQKQFLHYRHYTEETALCQNKYINEEEKNA